MRRCGQSTRWRRRARSVSWSGPSPRATQERIGDRDTRAALVGAFVDAPALRAVTAVLDPNRVEAIQQDVMSGRLVPEY